MNQKRFPFLLYRKPNVTSGDEERKKEEQKQRNGGSGLDSERRINPVTNREVCDKIKF